MVNKLAYSNLNLKKNPFGSLSYEDISFTFVLLPEIERIIYKLKKGNFLLQLIGNKGVGKTTQLLGIKTLIKGCTYISDPIHLNVNTLPEDKILLIDEFQNIKKRQIKSLIKSNVCIVSATHKDRSKDFSNRGYIVKNIIIEDIQVSLLQKIIDLRLNRFKRDNSMEIPAIPIKVIEGLSRNYGDNIREIICHLYNKIKNLSEVEDVQF